MKLYNLFPRLAGRFNDWPPHLQRAADMGFDWIFINPLQLPGRSGSLYSIRDFFRINPDFLDPASRLPAEQQVRAVMAQGEALGLRFMADLVINHCAYDSPLLQEHPEWFVREGGRVVHPGCEHDGQWVEWTDLARFDHKNSTDAAGLHAYCLRIIRYLLSLGFRGLRCDAAYQIPGTVWKRLMADIRKEYPDTVFVAETLGCSPEQTCETAQAGFDFIFNSSKWWDFSGSWLIEQHQATCGTVSSLSFPESHDTPRLYSETAGNVDALRQRYLFAGLFSAGVMMPMGYEFGFSRPLHVVDTRPDHWEQTTVDITGFIRHINGVKSDHPVFSEETCAEVVNHPNPAVLVLSKKSPTNQGEALLILNKDPWNWQRFHSNNLYDYLKNRTSLVDVSPDWPQDYLPTPFEFDLMPGMGRILVSSPH
ncbi:MAG: hypothetical protein RLZZ226_1536 [Pseudomonadota bacterium]